MSAIFKREFNAYFSSPIGYVFIAMFYCLSGFFFWITWRQAPPNCGMFTLCCSPVQRC